mgnify:CR=1 FL=1
MADLFSSVNVDSLVSHGTKLVLDYGAKLVGAIAVLVIGLWVIKIINKAVGKFLDRKDYDRSLETFVQSLLAISLKLMLIVTVLGMLGVEMTSFVALIGAAGLAVGMALSGTLQNFAGGVMILMFKPFKVGDAIDAQSYVGSVAEIQIFNTIIKTADNRVVILPNGKLSNGAMINITKEDNRRTEWTFGIGYGDSYDTAKDLLLKLIKEDDRILADPAPFVALHSLGDSSVNIIVRVWAAKGELWGVHFDMNEKVYKQFPENGLSIPYPQMDVHVTKNA